MIGWSSLESIAVEPGRRLPRILRGLASHSRLQPPPLHRLSSCESLATGIEGKKYQHYGRSIYLIRNCSSFIKNYVCLFVRLNNSLLLVRLYTSATG